MNKQLYFHEKIMHNAHKDTYLTADGQGQRVQRFGFILFVREP